MRQFTTECDNRVHTVRTFVATLRLSVQPWGNKANTCQHHDKAAVWFFDWLAIVHPASRTSTAVLGMQRTDSAHEVFGSSWSGRRGIVNAPICGGDSAQPNAAFSKIRRLQQGIGDFTCMVRTCRVDKTIQHVRYTSITRKGFGLRGPQVPGVVCRHKMQLYCRESRTRATLAWRTVVPYKRELSGCFGVLDGNI